MILAVKCNAMCVYVCVSMSVIVTRETPVSIRLYKIPIHDHKTSFIHAISLRSSLGKLSLRNISIRKTTYAVQEGIAVPVPGVEKLDALALGLGPGISVRKRRKQGESYNRQDEEGDGANPANDRVLP